MTRIDRYHRGAHAEPRHRSADQSRERDRVVVESLSQPHLPDAKGVSAFGLGDDVVDDVDRIRVRKEHDSGRHTATNYRADGGYSDLLGLIGTLAAQHPLS
jgi:hypothetical protein